jgi:Zn-dependent M28 family amino/carboxypeptidase
MKLILTAILFITFSVGTSAQNFKKHVVFLASDSLHGRAPATKDEKMAADYIKYQLLDAKCNSVVLQKFAFGNDSATNVIGVIDFKKDSSILISAHYDHLGFGNEKSKEIQKKGIHPGADDNASGVSIMIEIAKWISQKGSCKYNYVFAGWSAHEDGLFGSDYFTKSELYNSMKIRAVINFDMVGRLNTTSPVVRISGSETDIRFKNYFSGSSESLKYRFDDENISQSDLKTFAENGIPVLNYTTGIHSDYHKMSDTENKINYEGMKAIFNSVTLLLNHFC